PSCPSPGGDRVRRRHGRAAGADSRLRGAQPRAARPDRHRADLRPARHHAASEVPIRPDLHPPAIRGARRSAHPVVVLDLVSRHLGDTREEVLAAVRDGHYAAKQIYSRDRLVAFSHQRRFRTALELLRPFRGKRMIDYGCGDGTLIALLHETGEAPAVTVGADLDDQQVLDCRARLGRLAGVRFERIYELALPEHAGAYDVVVCTEVLEHVVEVDAIIADLYRLVADGGTLIVSVPVETGLPLVVKQTVRRMAGWRGIGHYKWTSAYSW